MAATTQFSNGIVYAGQFLAPLYLMVGAGLTPARAGWILITLTTVMAVITSRSQNTPGAFQAPFMALIALQLLVLMSASRLPIRLDPQASVRPR